MGEICITEQTTCNERLALAVMRPSGTSRRAPEGGYRITPTVASTGLATADPTMYSHVDGQAGAPRTEVQSQPTIGVNRNLPSAARRNVSVSTVEPAKGEVSGAAASGQLSHYWPLGAIGARTPICGVAYSGVGVR